MEIAHIELWPQRSGGLAAQAGKGQLADLVGTGLAWLGDIAINFHSHVARRHRCVGQHIGDRAIPAPAKFMQAGINHQPHGAQHLHVEMPEPGPGIRHKAPSLRCRLCFRRA